MSNPTAKSNDYNPIIQQQSYVLCVWNPCHAMTLMTCSRMVLLMMLTSTIIPVTLGMAVSLRVASWNLLAQEYIRPSKYPWVQSSEHLEWNHRKQLILDRLLDDEINATFWCLQEVQVDLFTDLMNGLDSVYDGILQNVSDTHNVATALLIRKQQRSSFQVKRVESRSRALIACLEDQSIPNNPKSSMLYVCSVHLDADKAMDRKSRVYHQEQRQNQLISLFKRISNHCRLDKVDMKDAFILIAGDFNMLRNNVLLSSIEQGTIHPKHNIPLHDAYLEAERCHRQPIRLYESAEDGRNERSNQEVRLVKSFRGGAILDYVLVSDKIVVVDTLLLHPSASVAGMERWPCIDHPSDHLPIGIDIEWDES